MRRAALLARGAVAILATAPAGREFHVRDRSIKEIARELHISRNTVRKVLRSGATVFEQGSESKSGRL